MYSDKPPQILPVLTEPAKFQTEIPVSEKHLKQ